MPRITNEERLIKLQEKAARIQDEMKQVSAAASKDLRNKRTKTLIEIGAMTLNLIGCGDSKSSLGEWESTKQDFVEFCKDLNESGKADEFKKLFEESVAKHSKQA